MASPFRACSQAGSGNFVFTVGAKRSVEHRTAIDSFEPIADLQIYRSVSAPLQGQKVLTAQSRRSD
jgi:hypothetical protein